MNNKVGFFEESPGVKSSIRLMSFFSLFAAIVFGILTINTPGENGLFITFGFLLGAFAPKAVQKFAELQIKK